MLVVLFAAVTIAVLAWTEPELRLLGFATTATAALAACVGLFTGDFERATLLTALITIAIIGASMVKFHHSARKLIVADFPLMFAGTVPFFFAQYRRMMTGLCVSAVILSAAAVASLFWAAGPTLPFNVRSLILAGCSAAALFAYRRCGGAAYFRAGVTQPRNYASTFAASALDVASWWPSRGLTIVDVADVALPLAQPIAQRSDTRPDIILIQHESVFDPRVFGLSIEPDIADFFTPPQGQSGTLNVEIFGGGSWQSEFSVLAGIASGAFGTDSYFLFKKGVGRFHHSLPQMLSALGYRTMLASSCRRSFLNYDAFYRGINVRERVFSDDFAAPFDVVAFEQTYTDARFLPAALGAFADKLDGDPAPRFLYALTNFNHGPHTHRLASPAFDASRAFALRALPDAEYAEYYARLAETAAAWRAVKSELAARFPSRPMLIVHYGDHQPVMTRRMEAKLHLSADPARTFTTFHAIEGLNFLPMGTAPRRLEIALLGTCVTQAAGLPLDAITATRAGFLDGLPDAESEANKRRLVRTMLEQKLIDLS